MMEGDFEAMLDLYLTDDKQHILDSPWTEKDIILFEENNISAGEDRDVQDLFDGETRNETNYSSPESETESLPPSDIKDTSDEQIQNLRVQDLNKLLRDLPRDEAAKIRKRRRNLKNRNYAFNCRVRKQKKYEDLLNENTSLKEQLEDGRTKLRNVWKEKEDYKKKCEQLQSSVAVYLQSKLSATSEMSPCC